VACSRPSQRLGAGLVSAGPPVLVWATVDAGRGLALITGRDVHTLVLQACPAARWSRSAKGWVITLAELADLCLSCQLAGVPYRERQAA